LEKDYKHFNNFVALVNKLSHPRVETTLIRPLFNCRNGDLI